MDTDTFVNWIGLVSAILISIMFIPQVVHVHKTKDTHAINYTFLGINVLASSLGLVYSIHFRCSSHDRREYICWSIFSFTCWYEVCKWA